MISLTLKFKPTIVVMQFQETMLQFRDELQRLQKIRVTLEAPLMQSKGKNIELASDTLDAEGRFALNASIPGLGYYMLKTYGDKVDSVELTLRPQDDITPLNPKGFSS